MTPTSPAHAQLRAQILRDVADVVDAHDSAPVALSGPYPKLSDFLRRKADSLSRAPAEGEGEGEPCTCDPDSPVFAVGCPIHDAAPGMDALERVGRDMSPCADVALPGRGNLALGPSVNELRPASAGEAGGGDTGSGPTSEKRGPVAGEQTSRETPPSPNPTTPTESEGLLPCPLCQNDEVSVGSFNFSGFERYHVQCESGECGCAVQGHDSEESAIAAWNRRTPSSPSTTVDEIVTRLYRRFKEWSERGFGPDDVTWCEVRADVIEMVALAGTRPPATTGGEVEEWRDTYRVMPMPQPVREAGDRLASLAERQRLEIERWRAERLKASDDMLLLLSQREAAESRVREMEKVVDAARILTGAGLRYVTTDGTAGVQADLGPIGGPANASYLHITDKGRAILAEGEKQ